MSAKHEKDYEYPLQINGRRVGNTTRLVDWMVQRWFIDGGFQVVTPSSVRVMEETMRWFKRRMLTEHSKDVSYTIITAKDWMIGFAPDLTILMLNKPVSSLYVGDKVSTLCTCRNPFYQHIRSPHD